MRVNANAVLRSWTLLAAFGGSYAPDCTDLCSTCIYSTYNTRGMSNMQLKGRPHGAWAGACRTSIEDRRAYVHRYCACAALRANVAGQIGNRFSPAESAFSACIGSGSSQSS